MKKISTLIVGLHMVSIMFGQMGLVKAWDKRFGGVQDDFPSSIIQTYDGGYLIGGSSYSGLDGDKTQPNWDTTMKTGDYWILKLDSLGNKEWDKRLGGLNDEYTSYYSIQSTNDGGYIVGGTSSSGISGNRTVANWNNTSRDFWVVKIDSLGNQQWDQRYGGNMSDFLCCVQRTHDGGYIFGGTTESGISGDKSEENWDTSHRATDYWIIKVDSSGNKEWDKRYGGIANDGLGSVRQTQDGGYILGGWSYAGATGNKTQEQFGFGDYWVVKIDSLGDMQWDKEFGGDALDGFSDIIPTLDGGYILGGNSLSNASGNKSEDICGSSDYWIVKIDSSGEIDWDKSYGSYGDEYMSSIIQTSDSGYLICGYSGTPSVEPFECDKSEPNMGILQTWLVKLNPSGGKQWDKTIFTTGFDISTDVIQSTDGCYVIAVSTNAGLGGYKTQVNRDTSNATQDFWIVKFCEGIVGIEEVKSKPEVSIYPNPFSSDVSIALNKEGIGEATFTISNTMGQVIYHKTETNLGRHYTKNLDLSFLPSGVYFIEVVMNGERVVRQVVKDF